MLENAIKYLFLMVMIGPENYKNMCIDYIKTSVCMKTPITIKYIVFEFEKMREL